jgi:hypothetical protein
MLYIIIIFLIFLIFYLLNKSIQKKENFNKIPQILYKTGPYDLAPSHLEDIFDINKKMLNVNKIYYYNDNECYDLIKTMNNNVIKAYDSLIPTAYKADLWRYCILYKYGGIYGDMTQKFYLNYDVQKDNVDMVLVRDIRNEAIQISFMATIPQNPFLIYVINNITNDILQKKKGKNSLDITGPFAFCRYFKLFFKLDKIPEGTNRLLGLDGKFYIIRIDLRQHKGLIFKDIFTNNIVASTKTENHNKELKTVTKMPKYSQLYKMDRIYK